MFGKQGGIAKANVSKAIEGKKNGGKVVGSGQVKTAPIARTPIKGNNNKLK